MHTLELTGQLPDPVEVLAFGGTESLTGVHRFHIDISGTEQPMELPEAIGQAASLTIRLGRMARTFHGVVTAIRERDAGSRHGSNLRLTFVSRLAMLRLGRQSRVFQEKRVDEIIESVLGRWGIPCRWSLVGAQPCRDLVTQYEESDFDFIERLLGEAGLMYRLEHDELGREALVFGDSPAFYDSRPLALRYVGESSLSAPTHDVVTHWSRALAIRENAVVCREHDYRRPTHSLESSARRTLSMGDGPILEHYEHHALYPTPSWQDAGREAERLLAQKRRRASRAGGESTSPALACGRTFTLEGHPRADANACYVATHVRHEGWSAPRHHRAETYRNRFECVPADVVYPLRRPRRRNVAGHLTATVVGPSNTEIHAEAMARVKVQFHWDREGRADDTNSCWLRTMQAWGGEGWGSQFIPRVGMEVVVGFEGGDPNRPIILGSVYNGTHPLPFGATTDPTRSGFRTRSTPSSEGFNELSFRDLAGDEEVFLRAERDLNEQIGRDHTTSVEGSRTETVGGDAFTRITGTRVVETVGREVKKTVGDAELHIGGQLRGRLGAGRHTVITGDDVARITGRAVTSIKKQLELSVGERVGVTAGAPDKPGSIDITAYGNTMLGTSMGLVLRAEERISLTCGESVLELTPSGIALRAPNVTVSATKRLVAQADGPSLRLDRAVQIAGEQVRLYSSGASVELDDEAHVDGRLVKLACGGALDSLTEDGRKPNTRPLRLRVADANLAPHANKAFVVKAGGARVEGTTGADGTIDVVVPLEATGADITIWLGKRGESECRRYAVELGDIEPIDTILGVQRRLRHLGHYHREPSGTHDAATRAALKSFQRQRGLPPTGDIDAPTRSSLVELHGA
jgi:type VI secretion system secreted protein VgrG